MTKTLPSKVDLNIEKCSRTSLNWLRGPLWVFQEPQEKVLENIPLNLFEYGRTYLFGNYEPTFAAHSVYIYKYKRVTAGYNVYI